MVVTGPSVRWKYASGPSVHRVAGAGMRPMPEVTAAALSSAATQCCKGRLQSRHISVAAAPRQDRRRLNEESSCRCRCPGTRSGNRTRVRGAPGMVYRHLARFAGRFQRQELASELHDVLQFGGGMRLKEPPRRQSQRRRHPATLILCTCRRTRPRSGATIFNWSREQRPHPPRTVWVP
jgi:hypothetical protein